MVTPGLYRQNATSSSLDLRDNFYQYYSPCTLWTPSRIQSLSSPYKSVVFGEDVVTIRKSQHIRKKRKKCKCSEMSCLLTTRRPAEIFSEIKVIIYCLNLLNKIGRCTSIYSLPFTFIPLAHCGLSTAPPSKTHILNPPPRQIICIQFYIVSFF